MNPKIEKFSLDSGFKILALAQLTPCEYSVFLYLINCSISGFDQFLTTSDELSIATGWDKKSLEEAIYSLTKKEMLKTHFKPSSSKKDKKTFRIGIQFNMAKWHLPFNKEVTSKDAIIFPFRIKGKKNLKFFAGEKKDNKSNSKKSKKAEATSTQSQSLLQTTQRILDSYCKTRILSDEELIEAEEYAKALVGTHPVDQILILIRHFGQRIPTLSLLASSWNHYMELFEEETQKVDLLGARKKHIDLDSKIKEAAEALLDQRKELGLSEDETMVLEILSNHRFPRRQLFWAYQLRSRYPKLTDFFAKHSSIMLPVTSKGTVVRRPEE